MYNIQFSRGIARVHLATSLLPECQPQDDNKNEVGWWQRNLSTIEPDGAVIGAGDGNAYRVEYCRSLGKGCMQNP